MSVGGHRPWQLDQPLEIAADHPVLGRGGRQSLEPGELAIGSLLSMLGQVRLGDSLAQLGDLGLGFVLLAELALNRLQLLAQQVLALALLHLGLDLRLDSRAELDHLELARQQLREPAQAAGDVDLLQQLLLFLGRDPQRSGDQVGEGRGIVDVGYRELQLLGQIGDLLDDLAEGTLDVATQGLELVRGLDLVGHRLDPRHQVGLVGDVLAEANPLGRLDQDSDRPVRDLEHPRDHADDADVVKLLGRRLLDLSVARGDHDQRAATREHVVDQLHRALLAHGERRQRVGIGDDLAQRKHRERVRQRL